MNEETAIRIATALEQIALELAGREAAPAPVYRAAGPVSAPAPFAPIGNGGPAAPWVCPVHHSSRVQPAGAVLGSPQVSKAGKTYTAFLACGQYDCNEKAPRGLPVVPERAVPPSSGGVLP